MIHAPIKAGIGKSTNVDSVQSAYISNAKDAAIVIAVKAEQQTYTESWTSNRDHRARSIE